MKNKNSWIILLFIALFMFTSCSIRPRTSRVEDNNKADKVVIKFSENEEQQSDEESILEFLGEESESNGESSSAAHVQSAEHSDNESVQAEPDKKLFDEEKAAGEVAEQSKTTDKDKSRDTTEEMADVESLVSQVEEVVRNHPAGTFVIGSGDVLEFKFFKNPEYNEKVRVRPDGIITLQHVGEIKVVGKSPAEITEMVRAAYAEILVDPEVTMFVREFSGNFCYVMGEVEIPGQYEVVKGMSIMRAIASAGGAKRSGKMNSVILIRGDQNRNTEISRVNLNISSLAKKEGNDMRVEAYDIIYVPRTFISNLDAFVKRIYDYAVPPLDLWIKYKYWDRWND